MNIKLKLYLTLLPLFFAGVVNAQTSVKDSAINMFQINLSYGFQFPAGDMDDRFGNNHVVGGEFAFKTVNNWFFGADYNFLFGENITDKDSLFNNIRTSDGNVIDGNGNFAGYAIFERGLHLGFRAGKIFPVFSPNPNSGILFTAGAGYLQHKIRIEINENTAPQLDGDYKRGYDRLSGGFNYQLFLGYMLFSNNRLLNFYGGFEFNQAFTRPYRDYYFDTKGPDPVQNRNDILYGFRVGWMIPFYKRLPDKYYYF